MNPFSVTRLLAAARLCASIAGLIALAALAGYIVDLPLLIHVRTGLEGMSPLTAIALLALAIAVFALTHNRDLAADITATVATTAGIAALISHAWYGRDVIGPGIGQIIFHMPPGVSGHTSIATASAILLIAASLFMRRPNTRGADLAAGAGLILSGIALLGYFYGARDLYALHIFNSMALNTATALFLLSLAAMFAAPAAGWAAVIGAENLGGDAIRRQLPFAALPILAGWVLLQATGTNRFGPSFAMALLVAVTVVPMVILVLREGRVLNALDRERHAKSALQERLSREMAEQLSSQAAALAQAGNERAITEAAMYQAQRMEALGQLTGGIAHDFNNLLMAIRGNLELLLPKLPPYEKRLHGYVLNATAAADKGAKVTAQLLAFSRSQKLDIRAIELDQVLLDARELIGNALGPDITLAINRQTSGVWVQTDPDQLALAILNLAVNARDAMPGGGRILIETSLSEEAPGSVSLRVIDTGTGMSEDIAALAAEPFFTTKERGKGTGLGLAQVYGFARQCGGDLHIKSAVGTGTTVEITLPRAEPQAATAKTPIPIPAPGGQPQGQQVLVIDDDDSVRAVIAGALEIAGFEVIEAADGTSGLALLDRTLPAAAVIDFLMPGMNGAEVARLAQQRRPGLPIIFVSGYSDTVALDGIDGAIVLRKPFNIGDLNRALISVMH